MKIIRIIKYVALFLVIFTAIFLISCSFLSPNFTDSFTSYIYEGSLDRNNYMTTYYIKDKGKIPYVNSINCYTLLGLDVDTTKTETTVTYKKDNGSYVILDAENDTITLYDYFDFLVDDLSNMLESSSNPYVVSYKEETTKNIKELTLDLSKYNIDIVTYNKVFYLPFYVVNSVFLNPLNYNFAFNGSDYYYINSNLITSMGRLNSYGKAFYSNSYDKNTTEELALFNYNLLLFEFDNLYGAKQLLGSSTEEYLTTLENNNVLSISDLKSTDVKAQTDAFTKFIASINDPHSGFLSLSPYLYYDTFRNDDYYSASISSKSSGISDRLSYLSSLKGNNYGNYNYSGNTAIISFDDFGIDFTANYKTKKPTSRDVATDNFALFYLAFEKIKANSKIENVVIDLTNNGGGEIDSLLTLLSFICGKYEVSFSDAVTGSTYTMSFAADINLDGIVNESDSYEGDYNYYILIDSPTFSAANSFAAIAKANTNVTLLGANSSGGACVVGPSALANGTVYQKSGITVINGVNSSGIYSIENGVSVDYTISENIYYRPELLQANINLLNVVA